MKHDPLNHFLLDEFPYLKEHYAFVKDGVFDLDTPSSVFYEEIFLPYLLSVYEKKDEKEVHHCCLFIEGLLTDEEETRNDIAMNAVLLPLYEEHPKIISKLPLGEKSREYVENWLMNI